MELDTNVPLVTMGISELDDILGGGLTRNSVYLLNGAPGSGKTTLAMQYLFEGRAKGEKVLYVTLSETRKELQAAAASHGWSFDGIDVFELVADDIELHSENQYTVYQSSEVELSMTTQVMLEEIERVNPTRLVVDSLAEVKLLSQSALRFRRQVLALKHYFSGRKCTVLFLDDKTTVGEDMQLESIVQGVINLEQLSPEYGAERRRLRVSKLRGQRYRGGYHDFTIVKGGLCVFPRIVASEHTQSAHQGNLTSGVPQLDSLLGGGIERGTSVLLLGPAGAGKSTTALQYAATAAARGERSVIFIFDERVETLVRRCVGLGIDIGGYIKQGLIDVRAIDPTEMSPGEFAHRVRECVEGQEGKQAAKIVVIDSLNGYLNAMPEERFLTAQLHELLTYLGHHGIVTFVVVAQHGVLGHSVLAPIDTSYLADCVILYRYFEVMGEVRQAISVLKKRAGLHERTLREFSMGNGGLHVGEPLKEFQGVLTGAPFFVGAGQHAQSKSCAS
ncbi:MAG: AAA family ATPase [Pseudomonadota bacterium]|nr:AAA family ATPase [Pseudomonadota bacterium]